MNNTNEYKSLYFHNIVPVLVSSRCSIINFLDIYFLRPMSTRAAKKAKLESLPQCPYGKIYMSKLYFYPTGILVSLGTTCYRKNPEHFKEYSHSDPTLTSTTSSTTSSTTVKPGLFNMYYFIS